MSESRTRASGRVHLQELDLLRGLAVVCMVVNHAGLGWAPSEPQPALVSVLVFLGEFAPVLFFFTTGVGHGIRASGSSAAAHGDMAYKVFLLLLADWFLQPSLQQLNVDFLAFIACSMVVLHLIGMTRRPNLWCALLLLFAVLGRFVLGVLLRRVLEPQHWLLAVFGVGAVPFSSYTLLPWLAYPLAGYLVGSWFRRNSWSDPSVQRRVFRILALTAGVTTLACIGLALKGQASYRWGSMSIAFFVQSVASIALGGLFAIAWKRIGGRLSAYLLCPGPASFAAVPIHYALVHELEPLCGVNVLGAAVALAALLLAIAVLELARRYAQAAAAFVEWVAAPYGLVIAGLALTVVLAWVALHIDPPWGRRAATLAQLLICGLLVNRIAGLKSAPAAATA